MRLFFTHDIFSTQRFGGISRYFVEMIKRVRRIETASTFEVFGGLYINQYLKSLPKVWGIQVPPFKNTGIFRKKLNNIIQDKLIRIKKPEVVHQTYYSDISFKSHVRKVITVPDMIHELYPESFSDKGRTSILKKLSCERAERIVTISETTKNDLVNLMGIDPHKIQVIYLANPLDGVKPDLESKPLVTNYILYVGDRHGYKNFISLIQAYARSKKIQKSFQLVCFGGGAFSPKERGNFSALGIDKSLYQTSGEDPLLAYYYQNARAFVYPSLYEGFGLPLLEAMSYGCPVICSNRSSIPEIAGTAGIYFNPESVDELQIVLEKALFEDSLLKEAGARGIDRNKQFSWDLCAKETLEVYRSLY
jgi:glycosyltransferase involved in cell wall biosynthesis